MGLSDSHGKMTCLDLHVVAKLMALNQSITDLHTNTFYWVSKMRGPSNLLKHEALQ